MLELAGPERPSFPVLLIFQRKENKTQIDKASFSGSQLINGEVGTKIGSFSRVLPIIPYWTTLKER